MRERIKCLRKELKLTQQEFADKLKIKRGAIANYELGRNDPIDAVVTLICREFNVNEQWLRTGEGEMFNTLSRDEEVAKFFGELLMPAEGDDFKRRFISALARLNPEQWKMIEDVAVALTEGMKKADP